MKILFYLTALVTLTNFSMSQPKTEIAKTEMEKLSWIFDRWVSKDADAETTSYEHWEKVSEDLFTGGSETIKNGDTLFSEKLKVEKTGNDIHYIADVKHNAAPVKFKLTSVSDTEAVFENPNHDFPQKIIYKLENGTLHASIEGPGKSGAWKKIDFYMNKMR